MLRAGLGKTPDGDYVDYFVATKRDEVPGRTRPGHAVGARALPRGLLTTPPSDRPTREDAHPKPASRR